MRLSKRKRDWLEPSTTFSFLWQRRAATAFNKRSHLNIRPVESTMMTESDSSFKTENTHKGLEDAVLNLNSTAGDSAPDSLSLKDMDVSEEHGRKLCMRYIKEVNLGGQ
jgi:hypothetical protein